MIKIYKASAGSGKTFTLAREYITLILGERRGDGSYHLTSKRRDRHRTILAITFTNKATEEMKMRIIHELAVLAGREPGWTDRSDYEAYLTKLFGCSSQQLAEAAGNALDDLLNDFSTFNVSTIDAFFQLVLRTFAREAEIDGNYDLEIDDELVIGLGIDEMFKSLNTSDRNDTSALYLLKWLETFMTEKVDAGASFNIFNRTSKLHNNLVKFINNVTDEKYEEHRDEITEYLKDPQRIIEFDKALADYVGESRKVISEACRRVLQIKTERSIPDKGVIHKNMLSLIRKWKNGYPADGKEPSGICGKTIASIDNAYVADGKLSPLRDETLDVAILTACIEIDARYARMKFYKLLRQNIFYLGLLDKLNECISQYRSDNATLLLSDTNAILHRIIGDDDTPFVYERIGQTLDHFLIDEFQDTSELQWKNLLPLVETSLSLDNDNLVIGDEKQCIYRFRNSEPKLLRDLHTAFQGRCKLDGTTPRENTNWRSSSDVIRFNNTLFTALADVTGNAGLYTNVVQRVSPKHSDHAGYIHVRDFGESDKDKYQTEALEFMTEQFQSALNAGYKPSDIAILVRFRREGDTIIRHLLSLQSKEGLFPGVRFISDKALTVGQSPAVRLIVSVLRFLTSTDDVTSPRNKSRREIARLLNRFEFFHSRGMDASAALHEALTSSEAVEDIAVEAIAVNCLNLPTVVERIITRYIPAADRSSQNLFICAFQDLVNNFVRTGSGDIRSFLDWWDTKGFDTPVVGVADENSVPVMTIHTAKGLEYKVVIIPFAGGDDLKVDEVKWFTMPPQPGINPKVTPPYIPIKCSAALASTPFAPEYEALVKDVTIDELNVMYVALTRAIDRLIIGLPPTRSQSIADYIRDALAKCMPEYIESQAKMIADRERSKAAGLGVNDDASVKAEDLFLPGIVPGSDIVIGSPTTPLEENKKSRSALTPSDGDLMPTYWSDDRDDLWENTRVDSSRRYDFTVARHRGTVIHDLLSRLRDAADIPSVVMKMVREGEIPANLAEPLAEKVAQWMAIPEVEKWFRNTRRVLIERPMLIDGKHPRPDRVVWTADGYVDIIDYKTGEENTAEYTTQVKKYVDALAAMGNENLRGFLWYLDTGNIVRCC